jgi:hypothetical protein
VNNIKRKIMIEAKKELIRNNNCGVAENEIKIIKFIISKTILGIKTVVIFTLSGKLKITTRNLPIKN